jgi:hypothetical protein
MKQRAVIPVLMLALLLVGKASAHHSTAPYDMQRDLILQGTVREFHWVNPHCWVVVEATDESGAARTWNVETGTPATAFRTGWSPTTLRPGDKATFVLHPRRDGEGSGILSVLILADGTRLSGMTQPAGPLPDRLGKP